MFLQCYPTALYVFYPHEPGDPDIAWGTEYLLRRPRLHQFTLHKHCRPLRQALTLLQVMRGKLLLPVLPLA